MMHARDKDQGIRWIASERSTRAGSRRHPHHARAAWPSYDTPPAPSGPGKERPHARGVDGLSAGDAGWASRTRRVWALGFLVLESRWSRMVAVVAGSSCRARPAISWRRPPVAGQLGRGCAARKRLAASHVFASLKRLAQGSAPGPLGVPRCAQPARKPCAEVCAA